MKRIHIKKYIATVLLASLFTGCSDILNETPRGIYTPEFFKTENGVIGGVTSLYANLRYVYGNGYWLIACEAATDEYTYGSLADNNANDMDLSGTGSLTPSSSRSDVLWGRAFYDINTASGIIENGTQIETISAALIAEARFFRAFDYFTLVQTFGGVPLDLGAGELKFNTSTTRTSARNTVPEVYTKAVFPDLLIAINDLPDKGRVTGGVSKTLARLILAKAYLTYGWWLENPKNIPTYPETARTDPDNHNPQWYYQQAYDIATAAIANPGPYGLQDTYYDVNLAQNDRNKEMLLYADHTEASQYYDGEQDHGYSTGSSPGNFAVWMVTWDYTGMESATTADWSGAKIRTVQREAAQAYGRPWTRIAPTIGAITKTFADKANDSRYDGTFVTTFRANWNKAGVKNEVLYNANGMPVYPGDAILTFLDEEPATPIDYSNSKYKSNVGAGVLPGRADFVVAPSAISRYSYPSLWKLGTYRTDNGTGLGQPNGSITRPFPIAKFSELYLVAAEAAVKGATGSKSARELVNVLRARAGKWRWSNNGNMAKLQDNSAAMIAATPATITIDYILAERSREFFGEGYRWWDLVRTQTWKEYASSNEICGSGVGNHKLEKVTRDIQPYLYLRPIPTGQLNGMEMTAAEKTTYQNPGYK
ncbi:putative outer membrane starch-binding protein [Dysgonomonas alginatilytica]|uniref:Putative outer membrane starch-binding protein n=1 Tax=Dysgonomonas alginatilytica TaxID=1605892 RepID=A0A2V3PSF0_9BACT|nr:RagB/SusD family nutrient uptake outer membrane protein [Dysgonomonas alginatilytica]PXV66333.1 putative outer membrane starch-binding protein [Dysgonomonas alginatilytica]